MISDFDGVVGSIDVLGRSISVRQLERTRLR